MSNDITNDLKERAEEILSEVDEIKEQMDQLKKWDSASAYIDNIKTVNRIVDKVIAAVEIASNEVKSFIDVVDTMQSADKSKTKLDTAIALLDDFIKLPFYLEWADDFALKFIVSSTVEMYNKFIEEKLTFSSAWEIITDNI
jgi:uncharacterized protein YukE